MTLRRVVPGLALILLVLAPGCRHENTAQQASNDTASTATNASDTASTVSPTDTGTTSRGL